MKQITSQQLDNLMKQKSGLKIYTATINAASSPQEVSQVKSKINPNAERTIIVIE
jgi:hypothetical protein